MIQILFTVDNFIRESLGGGLMRVINYSRYLKKHDIECRWLTLESNVDAGFEDYFGIRIRRIPVTASLPLQRKREALLKAAYEEAATLPRGQCVVSTDSCGLSWETVKQVWQRKWACIPSCHNVSMMPDLGASRFLGRLKTKLLNRLFLEGHAAVVPQTQTTRRFYENYFGFRGAKVQVIGNGVDCTRFIPPSPAAKLLSRQTLGLPVDALVVLSVGSVIPRKGMHLLLQAWPTVLERNPEARLVIAGTLGRRATFMTDAGQLDDYAQEILRLIAGLPRPESVVLTSGQVEDVETYYRAADVFALASEREGLPNVVLEAMACGLPCVLSPYAGFSEDGEELGVDGRHFVKCTHAPESLAGGLLALLADAGRRETLGRAARDWMVVTQDLPMIVDQWAALWRRIAGAA